MNNSSTYLVTAYAKAPQGTSLYESYNHVGVVLEVDCVTHQIIESEFTFVTNLAQRFFNFSFSPLNRIVDFCDSNIFSKSINSKLSNPIISVFISWKKFDFRSLNFKWSLSECFLLNPQINDKFSCSLSLISCFIKNKMCSQGTVNIFV